MVFLHQILFNLATIAVADVILMSSVEQVPSLDRVAPRYLKLVSSSKFWPFMLVPPLMLFVLLAMILLFSLLTSTCQVSLSVNILQVILGGGQHHDGSGTDGWTTSKSGCPCLCQNCSQWPLTQKTGTGSLLNHSSCLPNDPIA